MGHKLSEETKQKISRANKGRPLSPEHRLNLSKVQKRLYAEGKKVPWNKGTKGAQQGVKGERNSAWRGGRYIDKSGYVQLKRWGHPNSGKDGYIGEHRLVMSGILGRPLCPWEHVHHKNGIRTDNNPSNLLLTLKGVHRGKVKCPFCKKEFAIR